MWLYSFWYVRYFLLIIRIDISSKCRCCFHHSATVLKWKCIKATVLQHCITANSCGLWCCSIQMCVRVCLSQWLGDGALQSQNRQSCGCHHDHRGDPLYLLRLAVSCPAQNGKNVAGTAAFTHLPLSYESEYLDLFNVKSTENQLSFFFHIINDFHISVSAFS